VVGSCSSGRSYGGGTLTTKELTMNDSSNDRVDFDKDPDLTPKVFKFSYRGKDYQAREASAGAACRYRAASLAGAEMTFGSDDSKTIKRLGSLAAVENLLVGLCVFDDPCTTKNPDGTDKPIGQAAVDSWESKIQRRIFTWVKKSSDLSEDETIESLEKDRAEIDKKLARLREIEDRKTKTGDQDPGKE
jgi:hypothetical protein